MKSALKGPSRRQRLGLGRYSSPWPVSAAARSQVSGRWLVVQRAGLTPAVRLFKVAGGCSRPLATGGLCLRPPFALGARPCDAVGRCDERHCPSGAAAHACARFRRRCAPATARLRCHVRLRAPGGHVWQGQYRLEGRHFPADIDLAKVVRFRRRPILKSGG